MVAVAEAAVAEAAVAAVAVAAAFFYGRCWCSENLWRNTRHVER